PSAARTAIELLYGRDVIVPEAFLDRVGAGTRLPIGMLLPSATPLARVLPSRLHPSASWQEPAHALKNARALARARYRDLQAARGCAGFPPVRPRAREEPSGLRARRGDRALPLALCRDARPREPGRGPRMITHGSPERRSVTLKVDPAFIAAVIFLRRGCSVN